MNKRERIIEAALALFRENGIEQTKISDIVKKAGIAQGTFYLYFPSKLALMPAIAAEMAETIVNGVTEAIEEEAPFQQKVEQFVDAIFILYKDYKEIHALIYAGLASTHYLTEWESVYEPVYAFIRNLLTEAQEQSLIRPEIKVDVASKIIIGMVESAAEQIYLYDEHGEDYADVQKHEVTEFLSYALGIKKV